MSAVLPFGVFVSVRTPAASKISTHFARPRSAATWSGVRPSLPALDGLVPFLSNARTSSDSPAAAALSRAAPPSPLRTTALTWESAESLGSFVRPPPARRNAATMAAFPRAVATSKAVSPSAFLWPGSDPARSNRLTSFEWLLCAARIRGVFP